MGTALSGSCCGVQGEGSRRATISVVQPVPRAERQLMAPCFLASGLAPWLLLGPGRPCLSPSCQAGDGQVASVLQLLPRVSPTSPGMTAGAVPANAPALMALGTQPSLLEQGEAGGQIAACLHPLNTGIWVHNKMVEELHCSWFRAEVCFWVSCLLGGGCCLWAAQCFWAELAASGIAAFLLMY